MIKKSLVRFAVPVKALEPMDGTKYIGKILIKDGTTFHLIKGDKVIVIRRKKIIRSK